VAYKGWRVIRRMLAVPKIPGRSQPSAECVKKSSTVVACLDDAPGLRDRHGVRRILRIRGEGGKRGCERTWPNGSSLRTPLLHGVTCCPF